MDDDIIIIVPNSCLIFDDLEVPNQAQDYYYQQWFLNRTERLKKQPTVYTGNSGLIFAVNRNNQTIVPIRKKGLCPIKTKDNKTLFVDASECHGIRRYALPKNAEVLYTTEILNSQQIKETIIMGFKVENNIILLFKPELLVNEEKHEFFKITQIRYGSETLFHAFNEIFS